MQTSIRGPHCALVAATSMRILRAFREGAPAAHG
jgi:hypothetical protein